MRLPIAVALLALVSQAVAAQTPPPSARPVVGAGYAFKPDPADYYPAESRELKEEGLAKIKLCYDLQGMPEEVALDETSGFTRLDEAAVRYGYAVRIRPGRVDGRPKTGCVVVPVRFSATTSRQPPDQRKESPLPPVQVPPDLVDIPPPAPRPPAAVGPIPRAPSPAPDDFIPLAAAAADNTRLVELMKADQAEREGNPTPEQWQDIARRDAVRRSELMSILRAGDVNSAGDYFNAALIMQHGDKLEDIKMANALATISTNLDPSNRTAAWLTAASWDRILLRMHRPQWYGTQYVRDDDGKWMLYEVDESAVTDADRAALFVPSLAQARARVKQMNGAK